MDSLDEAFDQYCENNTENSEGGLYSQSEKLDKLSELNHLKDREIVILNELIYFKKRKINLSEELIDIKNKETSLTDELIQLRDQEANILDQLSINDQHTE